MEGREKEYDMTWEVGGDFLQKKNKCLTDSLMVTRDAFETFQAYII